VKVFFDSSAFAKRYLEEKGSDAVEKLCGQATVVAVSIICLPEIISALCRLLHQSVLSKKQYDAAKQALLHDLGDAVICTLTPQVIRQPVSLLESNKLRAMDALHVGCALEWKAEIFVSADRQQLLAAQRAGLKTISV
jgi:hypothetical protein